MMVYVAYGLLVLHVTFGILQSELSLAYVVAVAVGFITVLALHLVAGLREAPADREATEQSKIKNQKSKISEGFIPVCSVVEIPEKRAKIVCVGGERVAIFKYDGKVSAVSNVCQHQNGPLGEGKILDGCITCPWHGYQYLPETGASPPPFVEKVPTFNVRVKDGQVLIHPKPNLPGVRAEPAQVDLGSRLAAELTMGRSETPKLTAQNV
jgi:nitrite reductase/ring-hydroxylating ferredoxin subunit